MHLKLAKTVVIKGIISTDTFGAACSLHFFAVYLTNS